MTSLKIEEEDIPQLEGTVAIISGASSGIGLATAKLLATKGATVYNLDIDEPEETILRVTYVRCDISSWTDLLAAFATTGAPHIAVANAGIDEDGTYITDSYDDYGNLLEPSYKVIDVNLRGTLNFIKVSLHLMKKNAIAGSIVITSSATAYLPEQTLPVYSGTKAALINYMRAMRSLIRDSNITINAVVPAATITKLLPMDLAGPILAAGLPVSTAEFVALAVAYSAVAQESRKVQGYGKDGCEWIQRPGRWNGRTILTLGDSFTELEEDLSECRGVWFGHKNLEKTKMQQAATDFRDVPRG
ncbi:hypothetical protein AA0112_g10825 [Alternaria arborescens]|nr:hypothetical protein AA0112_g10825 [Alternaria arborescens]